MRVIRNFITVPLDPDMDMELKIIIYGNDKPVTAYDIETMIGYLQIAHRGFKEYEEASIERQHRAAQELKQRIVDLVTNGTMITRHLKEEDWYINGDVRTQPIDRQIVRDLLDSHILKISRDINRYRLIAPDEWRNEQRIERLSMRTVSAHAD